MRKGNSLKGSVCLVIFFAAITAQFLFAQNDSPAPTPPAPWPRKLVKGGTTVSVYQPQLDKWQDNQIDAYAAAEVETAGSQSPSYGVFWFTARTEVDKISRQVTLMDFNFTKAHFPTAANNGQDYVNIIKDHLPTQSVVALDQLEADLNMTDAQIATQKVPINNDPPKIIFSTTPALLILIDGQPELRLVEKTNLQRVINTHTLILFDPSYSLYFLQLMDGWMQSESPDGPWTISQKSPANGDKIKDQLVQSKQVVLLEEGGPTGNKSLKDGVPTIYTSTVPAELIQTKGEPQFTPVKGLESLLYVDNSSDNIFLYTESRSYYVLIAGRWFTSAAVTGPWSYAPSSGLPADFSKIPTDSPKASVLVSIPGTPQAKEAVIANQIPQTATITRSAANLTVNYDGSPKFKSIKDTSLQYAENTVTPVIQVSSNNFYAVQNGVWFAAPSAVGPWGVATNIPGAIYAIPSSSALHYVTYVKVYGYTDQYVYVGYTPGYYGTVVSTDGVVVYGTGYSYPSYVGTVWIGAPYTYGVGAGFTWGVATGWALGFGMGYASSACYPWWGPVGYYGHAWAPAYGWGAYGGAAATNVYGHWGNTAYQGTRAAWANPYTGNVGTASRGTAYNSATGASTAARGARNTNVYTGNQAGAVGGVHYNPTTGIVSGGRAGYAGNMYTGNYEAGGKGFAYDTKTGQGVTTGGLYGDHDGNVYKQGGSGWQQFDHNSGSWGSAGSQSLGGLNNFASSRSFGGARASGFSGFSGGRFGGGRRR